ncbi:hypothetical protein [Aureispira anguillae]|uniref:Uncharacterized protein n=1 Tax=Aureispira anguillae TaxID=2864201 RepID=A0A915VK99_9BACT|nr:hypothetical protein [Aureispira anguillae]BDS09551.1 hypothetical protein AsAng_0002520 [Aureispira anguillae]
MKRIGPSFIILLLIFFISPFISIAQGNFQWEGRWEVVASEYSFCNIHVVTSLIENQSQPTAILEGLIQGKPFRIKCNVKELPQRNSIVFYEAVAMDQEAQYASNQPLIILALNKAGRQVTVNPIWMQLDITKEEQNKTCTIRKVAIPRYKGTYTVNQDATQMALKIAKVKKASFEATINSNNTAKIACACELQARHLAVCYPDHEKGVFYLDFNEEGVKLIRNYDENIYQPKKQTEDKEYLVLNTTFKK